MKKPDAKKRIDALKAEIREHRYAYHVLDKQTISDAALDSLKHELFQLEQQYPDLITSDSPTQRIGGEPLPKFQKVTHASPMLSMEDVFVKAELESWVNRLTKRLDHTALELFCMVKLDGLAVSLTYEQGLLVTAATRGNGRIGENITQNVKTIESIPLRLKNVERWNHLRRRFIVRGEIYFPVHEFERLNTRLEKEGAPAFANPRNAAAGSVRQLDSTITASRNLAFVPWDVVTDHGQLSHEEEWELLRDVGFRVEANYVVTQNTETIETFWNKMQAGREQLNYWIDGIVVRVNVNETFQKLGVVGKTPRGLVAWKFPAEESTSVVESIDWYVGRTGVLTPVATIRPTLLAGTTVTHASLHNIDEIERLDVRVGDTVVVYKAGDIIPKVKEALKKLRPKGSKKTHAPDTCPVCGSSVGKKPEEVALVCSNRDCFAQEHARMILAAKAFEIDGFGPQTAAALLEHKLVQSPADLFKLSPEDVLGLEGFAEVSANKLVEEIQSRKQIPLENFLWGLGIRHVGEETARLLAESFHQLEKVQRASTEDLLAVAGIGDVVADSITAYFREPIHKQLVRAYKSNGVQIKEHAQPKNQPLAGQTFVFTGTLASLGREEAEKQVRVRGGKASGSVSKNTSYVVVGKNAGSKADTAKTLGIPTLTETQFVRMIQKNS